RGIGAPESRLDAAVERGRAYLAAGADCVFVPGVTDRATIGALVTGIGGPVNILAVAGSPSIHELESLGVARVSLGSGPARAALSMMRDLARELKSAGTYSFASRALPYAEVNELMK
ncbi:MAG TPA: isocitrate lyase/phosphoenolpyruvate mutase family protein, partial [Vicinamibacterales bacterium]|nr:isocitrate lyase/phosphoenolpyruvate mutase family protein [Vicinamibacterales bacterium]